MSFIWKIKAWKILWFANKCFYELTDTKQIRTELHTTFQDIYKLQTNLDTSPNALTNFLCLDGDTKPLDELEKRKIPKTL